MATFLRNFFQHALNSNVTNKILGFGQKLLKENQ